MEIKEAPQLSERVYLHTRYERIWHWLQALVIVFLMLTGVEVHSPGSFRLMGFETAVMTHRTLGFLLMANTALGLLYHLASGQVKQYFSSSQDFLPLAVRLGRHYLWDIFHGRPHPFRRSRDQRLNPLQRVVYVATLSLLLPIQASTGLLLWGAQRWPETVGAIGGLAPLAAVHTMGAWIFAAFLIMHVYLTTTGRTPTANLRAMISGWAQEDSPDNP
jgi:thiosulfate reductase cytochrome b subunit